jgi:hypothetical protein
MTDFSLFSGNIGGNEPESVRSYIDDLALTKLDEALRNVDDTYLVKGFSKENILAIARPVYDTSINMVQAAGNTVNNLERQGHNDLVDLVYTEAADFMKMTKISLENIFNSLIDFKSMGWSVGKLMDLSAYSEIFEKGLLESFVKMGNSFFYDFDYLPNSDDTAFKKMIDIVYSRIKDVIYAPQQNKNVLPIA